MELLIKDSKTTLTVSENIFNCNLNKVLIHQIIVAYQAGLRQGTCSQKSRAEVRGSGKKPWRQKGTGRARAGTIKSPIWRSGGVTFAAQLHDYSQKVNKKMFRAAIKNILSELIRQNRLILVEKFTLEVAKTKYLIEKINAMGLNNVLIIVKNNIDINLLLAARNLYRVNICNVFSINPVSLIKSDNTLITVDAVKYIEEIFV